MYRFQRRFKKRWFNERETHILDEEERGQERSHIIISHLNTIDFFLSSLTQNIIEADLQSMLTMISTKNQKATWNVRFQEWEQLVQKLQQSFVSQTPDVQVKHPWTSSLTYFLINLIFKYPWLSFLFLLSSLQHNDDVVSVCVSKRNTRNTRQPTHSTSNLKQTPLFFIQTAKQQHDTTTPFYVLVFPF